MNKTEEIANEFSRNLIEFSKDLARASMVYASNLRRTPLIKPPDLPDVSPQEGGRCSQIYAQVLMELAHGNIEEMYKFLTPYVKKKFEERMGDNILGASVLSDD